MTEVWEVFEYSGSRELRAICETEQEADEYIESNSVRTVTYASGSYVWYLEKINR